MSELLKIANNILNLLEYPSELEREEDLFSDEFYIAIVGNLISDRKFDIQPGNTVKEKIESLKKLVDLLSQIIDMDLSHILPEGIIVKKDKISTKCLLELIEELIKALINENEEDSQASIKNNLSDNNIKNNISDDNILRGNRLKIDSEKSDNKIHDKDDEIDMDKILREQKNSNEKKNEPKLIQESDINNININSDNNTNTNLNINLEKEKENESLNIGNRSCFEQLEFEKIIKDAQAKENGEDSYIRKTFSQNDISKYERVLAENEALNQVSNENINYENENENKLNEAPVMNVSNISNLNNSDKKNEKEEYEIPNLIEKKNKDNNNKNNKKENKNNFDFNLKNYNDSNISDNLFNDSIKAYSVPNEYMNKPEISISASGDISILNNNVNYDNKNYNENDNKNLNLNIENDSGKKLKTKETSNSNINISGDLSTKKNSNRKTVNTNTNKNYIKTTSSNQEESQSDISKSSIYSNKKLSTQESKNKKNNNKNNKSKQILNTSSSLIEDTPITDEEFKFELMKELRRLYGNDINKIFPKNSKKQNNEILEVMLKNIKNARAKMMKLDNKIPDPDDLLTRDFIHRYQKELQYIINYYKNQKKRKNYLQEQALKTITQNIPTMRKIQEIYDKNLENQIEKKKKIREEKNHKEQLKLCKEIYSKALDLEKEKYIEETINENKLKQLKNEAKAETMLEVEKFYTDKINFLNNILKKEKKERENAHKAQVLFLEKISKQRKGEFKKQIDLIFQKFDEEDMKNENDEINENNENNNENNNKDNNKNDDINKNNDNKKIDDINKNNDNKNNDDIIKEKQAEIISEEKK